MNLTHDITGHDLTPGYSTHVRAWRLLAPHTGPCLPRLTLAAEKGSENRRVLAGVADCGRN